MAKIQSFTLKNFKGAEDVTLDIAKRIDSPVITLIGLNESGKTTILEGLSYFVTGDNSVASIFDGVHSKLDATSLIPIHRKAAFTGTISIAADVILDEEDFKLANELAKKRKLGIDKSSFLKKINMRREYVFEDSELKKTTSYWGPQLMVYPLTSKNPKIKVYEKKDTELTSLWAEVYAGLVKTLPRIAYFPTFLVDMPARIYLKEYDGERAVNKYYRQVFQDILDSLNEGLTLEKHVCKRIEDFVAEETSPIWYPKFLIGSSKTTIDLVFQKISSAVTKEVLGSWRNIFQLPISAKNVSIEWQIDTEKGNIPYASFFVSDGESRYAISERSLGFRWFFSFLLFTGFKKASNRPTLFVFDEPAANLHAKAQAELLKSFAKIIGGGNKVVYSTHSHHMINPKWLSGAYIVENEALDYESDDAFELASKPTKVKATSYREFVSNSPNRTSYFQPVLEKLEYVSPEILGSSPFLIIEGISDYYAMKIVKDANKDLTNFSLMPGTGSGALGPLISLLMGRGEKFIILLDDDKSGKNAAKKYKEEWLLSSDNIMTLGDISSNFNNKCLEGLICVQTFNLIKTQMQLANNPTKKQTSLYFAEQSMTIADTSCFGAETVKNFNEILKAVNLKFA